MEQNDKENSIAWELLKDRNNTVTSLIRSLTVVVVVMSIMVSAIVGMFVWYLNQYDFSCTTSNTEVSAESTDGNANAIICDEKGEVNVNE